MTEAYYFLGYECDDPEQKAKSKKLFLVEEKWRDKIVAALRSSASAEPVAWQNVCGLGVLDTTTSRAKAETWRLRGDNVVPLYAHPVPPAPTAAPASVRDDVDAAYEKHIKKIYGNNPKPIDSITHFYAGFKAGSALSPAQPEPAPTSVGDVYTDIDGKVWHPHRGFWCWETTVELTNLRGRFRDVERAFTDACDEVGCVYDNEALLEAIHALKAAAEPAPTREEITDLPLFWQGRANAFRLMDGLRTASHPRTLALADAYEECANELRVILALRQEPAR